MSQFENAPAVRRFLRVLGTGESLSSKDIRGRGATDIKSVRREELVAAGLLAVAREGRRNVYTLTHAGVAFVRDELGGPSAVPSPETSRLSSKERIALYALLSPELDVAYSEVKSNLGISIGPDMRASLRDKDLVVVSRRPIRLELTEKGWQVAAEELSRPGDAGDPPLLKLLHRHFARALDVLRDRNLGLVDLFVAGHPQTAPPDEPQPRTVGSRVIDAYQELVYEPGGWVSLRRLREQLADVNTSELDKVLTALFRDGKIKLISEVNQRALTDADRRAALAAAGDYKHLYSIG